MSTRTPTARVPAAVRRTGRLALFAAVAAAVALLGTACQPKNPSPGASLPGLNTAVRDGNFEFVVTAMTCGHDSVGRAPFVKKPQGQYCVIELTVKNIGTEARTFADALQKAYGPTGISYGTDGAAGVLANAGGATNWNVVNPGNQVAGKIVYDIPQTASIVRVELHDSALSRGVTVQVAAST